jgi:MFS family permease
METTMLGSGSISSLILLFIYGMAGTSLVTQSVPVIGDIAHQFGLTPALAGWVISLPSLVTALASVFGGWVVDRVGDKRVLFVGALFGVVGNFCVFWANSAAMLMLGRLIEGVAYLALTVGAVALIMRTTSGTRRSVALGIWTAHTAVGIGLTLSIIAPLAQHGDRWRWAFGGHGILMAVLTVTVALLPDTVSTAPARRLRDIWAVLKSRDAYRVAFSAGAAAFVQTGVMAALTVYLTKTFSVTVATAAGVGTLAEVFVVISCAGVGQMLKAGWAMRPLLLVSGAIAVLGGVLLYAPNVPFLQAIAGICVFSLGIGACYALVWTFVPGAAPSPSTLGVIGGFVSQATYIGVLFGPPVMFMSFQRGGAQMRITLLAISLIALLAGLPIWRQAPRKLESPHSAHSDV